MKNIPLKYWLEQQININVYRIYIERPYELINTNLTELLLYGRAISTNNNNTTSTLKNNNTTKRKRSVFVLRSYDSRGAGWPKPENIRVVSPFTRQQTCVSKPRKRSVKC